MEIQRNRRRWIREVLNPPEIGLLDTGGQGTVPGIPASEQPHILFVDLLNRSLGGGIIRTKWQVAPETVFKLRIYSNLEERWQIFSARGKWTGSDPHYPAYRVVGVEFLTETDSTEEAPEKTRPAEEIPLLFDFEFLKNTRFFSAVPREAVCALLNSLNVEKVKAGGRLFTQGTKIDRCFIIQKGSCTVSVGRDGEPKPIGRLYEGDAVGETALLDDHPVEVNADADTHLSLWSLSRTAFDRICNDHPELHGFLTRLLMDRFAATQHSKKRTLGRYLITDLIGEGAHSVVYKGLDRRLNLPVILKMIKHETTLNPHFVDRFRPTAASLLRLRHENITQIHEIVEGFRTLFLVMEREEGESLRSLLQRWKRISLPRATDFLIQCCLGLEYARRQGVTHGDIKPSNLMITPGDRLKILDFGLVQAGKNGRSEPYENLPYAAPELLEGRPADDRSDIYALGMIAYEMLTGHQARTPQDPGDEAETALQEDLPDPRRMVPGIPEILRRFILKSGDRDPAGRFEGAAAALKHLKPLAEDYGIKRPARSAEKPKVAVFSLRFDEKNQDGVKTLLEDFNRRIKKLDAELKAINIKEL